MKIKFTLSISIGAAMLFLFLLAGCSKDAPHPIKNQMEENASTSFQVPQEFSQHLTEAELEEIYHSTPPAEAPRPDGSVESRSGSWHFWLAWGHLPNETFYAVVGNCTPFEVPGNICYDPADCPDPSTWVGRYADTYGQLRFVERAGHHWHLGTMTHHFNNMTCQGAPDWPNFGFLPDGSSGRAQFRPSTVPGEVEISVTPELFTIRAITYPCNSDNLHFLCWRPSTGIFENVQGTLTWRFYADPDEVLGQGIFGPPADAVVIVSGWVYY